MKQSDNLGATDEEVKTSLREAVDMALTICNQQCVRISSLERELAAKSYEFLNSDFLALMNDIGRLGHEKFGADAIEVAGARRVKRHQKEELLRHAHQHLWLYEDGVKHDKLGTLQGHLAAAAFNCMLEFWFSQGE